MDASALLPDHDAPLRGFYRWDGSPCRVVADETALTGERAEIYVAGKGFVAMSLTELWHEGVEISEAEFKERVLREIEQARYRGEG